MIPVDQTTFGVPEGNCFSACVASILELPIARVPFFMHGDWWTNFCAWCVEHRVVATYRGRLSDGTPPPAPPGYSIWTGLSPRAAPEEERYHAVVALDGALVHDPHVGDRRGVLDVLDYVTVAWETQRPLSAEEQCSAPA
jgi:hypothetical protein